MLCSDADMLCHTRDSRGQGLICGQGRGLIGDRGQGLIGGQGLIWGQDQGWV